LRDCEIDCCNEGTPAFACSRLLSAWLDSSESASPDRVRQVASLLVSSRVLIVR